MTEPAGQEILLDTLVSGAKREFKLLPVDASLQRSFPVASEEEELTLQIHYHKPAVTLLWMGLPLLLKDASVGEAQRVTVSWSSSGVAYPLGLFEPAQHSSVMWRMQITEMFSQVKTDIPIYSALRWYSSKPVTVVIQRNH